MRFLANTDKINYSSDEFRKNGKLIVGHPVLPGSGRPLGAKNKPKSFELLADSYEHAVEKLIDMHSNPLLIMAKIMDDDNEPSNVRLKAANDLAGYVIQKLPNEIKLLIEDDIPDPIKLAARLHAVYLELAERNALVGEIVINPRDKSDGDDTTNQPVECQFVNEKE